MVFNERIADVAERYLKKDQKVYVEGSLQTRKWIDQSGQEKYATEVVIPRFKGELQMLGGPNDNAGNGGGQRPNGTPRGSSPSGAGGRGGAPSWEPDRGGGDLDHAIPFAASWQ